MKIPPYILGHHRDDDAPFVLMQIFRNRRIAFLTIISADSWKTLVLLA